MWGGGGGQKEERGGGNFPHPNIYIYCIWTVMNGWVDIVVSEDPAIFREKT